MSDPGPTRNPAAEKGNTGIFSMTSREVGRFCEETYSWSEGWFNKLLDAFKTDDSKQIASDKQQQQQQRRLPPR